MASVLIAIIIVIILVMILVVVGWLSLAFQIKFASGQDWRQFINKTSPYCCFFLGEVYGQTIAPPVSPSTALPTGTPPQPTPPPIVQPTPVPTATQTAANPNFQYLPQKAYVQSFAPEQGVPSSTPLQAAPVVAAPQTATGSAPQAPFDIMAILATVGAAGAYLKGHFVGKKAEKVEGIAKETMSGTLLTKEQLTELAKQYFSTLPDKGESIKDAPSIRLENLNQDKEEFAEKAAKA